MLSLRTAFALIACVAIVATAAWLPAADPAPTAQKPATVEFKASTGVVSTVVLYRGQALVTRTVSVEGGKGTGELVVGDLPEQVVPNSLFAESVNGLEIRAVRYRARAVGEEPREEVRKIEEEIEATQESVQQNQREQQVLAKRTAYLDQMEGFSASTAKTDLARGFLDAPALEKLSKFAFEQREAVAKRQTELEKQLKELNKSLSLLNRKRAELTRGHAKSVREALLFLDKQADGPQKIELSYLVGGCGWSPTYTIRAGKDRKEVSVECSALISQLSGENWESVKLTLSTASPSLAAAGPGLAPLPVGLVPAGQVGRLSEKDVLDHVSAIRGRQSEAIAKNRSALTLSDNIGTAWSVNTAANDYQTLELATGKDVLNLPGAESRDVEGPSLTYQMAKPVSLNSRSDQQMVRIFQTNFKSTFYHVATPVLTGHVYREAEMVNNSNEDLLAGPMMVYLDGKFVGRGEIPTVARGQTFLVGFGADPQLRARRELADRSESVQGGNRELTLKYRIVIENFKEEAVPMRVFDRLPHSDRPTDVRLKLADTKDPLSADKVYLRTERPKGILRWDIECAGSAIGEKVRIIDYGYTIDFDRNLAIQIHRTAPGQPAASPAMMEQRHEFEQMQRARYAK